MLPEVPSVGEDLMGRGSDNDLKIGFGRVRMNMFSRFVKDESGATAIEYGLIAAIVAVGIIAALTQVKGALQTTFNSVATQLNANNSK